MARKFVKLDFRIFETTLILFTFDPNFLFGPPIFWWGGAKNLKIKFDQFSRHFRQFWATLIFFTFDPKFFVGPPPFWGGGGAKFRKSILTNFLAIFLSSLPCWMRIMIWQNQVVYTPTLLVKIGKNKVAQNCLKWRENWIFWPKISFYIFLEYSGK